MMQYPEHEQTLERWHKVTDKLWLRPDHIVKIAIIDPEPDPQTWRENRWQLMSSHITHESPSLAETYRDSVRFGATHFVFVDNDPFYVQEIDSRFLSGTA